MTKIAFYMTNHGFGHCTRNVPIINVLLQNYNVEHVYIKTDEVRCEFLRRNFNPLEDRISYYDDLREVGFILKAGTMQYDALAIEKAIASDQRMWAEYVVREEKFLRENGISLIVSDTVAWPIYSANNLGIKSVLIGNFSWAQSYASVGLDEKYWKPYETCYKMATKSIWYAIHDKALEEYTDDAVCVSLVARSADKEMVQKIKREYKRPIIFVSLGASAELDDEIDVSHINADVLFTRGIRFVGENAHELPLDMINTPDYISAADYCIVKGGWSTVAEVILYKGKAAMLFRGDFTEDNITRATLVKEGCCIEIKESDLQNLQNVIDAIDRITPTSPSDYWNDINRVCMEIMSLLSENCLKMDVGKCDL